MISPVLSIDIDSSAQEVTMIMTTNNIGSLFDEYGVPEENKILGVILVKDLMTFLSKDFRVKE